MIVENIENTSGKANVRVVKDWLPGKLNNEPFKSTLIHVLQQISRNKPVDLEPATATKRPKLEASATASQHAVDIEPSTSTRAESTPPDRTSTPKRSSTDRIRLLKERFERMNETAGEHTQKLLQQSKAVLREIDLG